MESSIYRAPESELIDSAEVANQFYVVSKTKLIVLYIATAGLYELYWFYTNWSYYRSSKGINLWPVPRSLFSIFFAHSLFGKVDTAVQEKSPGFVWSPSVWATLYVLLTILSNVGDRFASTVIGDFAYLIAVVTFPMTAWVFVNVQGAVNISQGDPEGTTNSTFTAANYIWIALGTLVWALVVAGVLDSVGVISLD